METKPVKKVEGKRKKDAKQEIHIPWKTRGDVVVGQVRARARARARVRGSWFRVRDGVELRIER